MQNVYIFDLWKPTYNVMDWTIHLFLIPKDRFHTNVIGPIRNYFSFWLFPTLQTIDAFLTQISSYWNHPI